jgi:hypothetical protein
MPIGYLITVALMGLALLALRPLERPALPHNFDLFHSIRFEILVDGIEAFAAWVRSRPARTAD